MNTISRTNPMYAFIGLVVACQSAHGGSTNGGAIDVRVDLRVELMSIIFRLADVPDYNLAGGFKYASDADKHFAKSADHAAVARAQQLCQEDGIAYDAVIMLALNIDNAFDLRERIPFDQEPCPLDPQFSRWNPDKARSFLRLVRRFVRDSDFAGFAKAHQAFYNIAEQELRSKLATAGHVSWLDAFYGDKPLEGSFAIPGLLTFGSYGPSITLPDGKNQIGAIVGVWGVDAQGRPEFKPGFAALVAHEFSHSYCNPLVDQYAEQLKDPGQKIFAFLKRKMSQQAYTNWRAMMYESCVRACVVRYLLQTAGPEAAKDEIREQEVVGFKWTGELVDLLDKYESGRDRYPTFAGFFPQIVSFFQDYARRDLKTLLGVREIRPIVNAIANFAEADSMLLVVPDKIADEALAGQMKAYLQMVHEAFYKPAGSPMVKASEVTESQLGSRALVLYGSPNSNAVLKRVLDHYGIVLASDHVVLGKKRIDGQGLVVITCHPNPFSAELPVLLYASADDRRVHQINSFMVAEQDYLIGHWGHDMTPVTVREGHYNVTSGGDWVIAD